MADKTVKGGFTEKQAVICIIGGLIVGVGLFFVARAVANKDKNIEKAVQAAIEKSFPPKKAGPLEILG
jgi:hypothetical protein